MQRINCVVSVFFPPLTAQWKRKTYYLRDFRPAAVGLKCTCPTLIRCTSFSPLARSVHCCTIFLLAQRCDEDDDDDDDDDGHKKTLLLSSSLLFCYYYCYHHRRHHYSLLLSRSWVAAVRERRPTPAATVQLPPYTLTRSPHVSMSQFTLDCVICDRHWQAQTDRRRGGITAVDLYLNVHSQRKPLATHDFRAVIQVKLRNKPYFVR